MVHNEDTEVQGFDEPTGKGFRIPKWVFVIGAVAVLLVVVAAAIPMLIDQERYKSLVVGKIQQATGYDVAWTGKIDFSILPLPHVRINDATISNKGLQIVSVRQADISVELMPLLQRKIQISSINLKEPKISLLVDATGRKTWMTEQLEKADAEKNPESRKDEQQGKTGISFDSIKIEKGRLTYADKKQAVRQDISDVDLDLSAKTLAGPFELTSDFVYDGNEFELRGNAGQIVEGKPIAVDLSFGMPGSGVSGVYKGELQQTANGPAAHGDLKLLVKNLSASAQSLTKKDVDIPAGIDGSLDLTTNVNYDGSRLQLDSLTLAVGPLKYAGSIGLQGLETPRPLISLNLKSTDGKIAANDPLVKVLSGLSLKASGRYADQKIAVENGVAEFQGQSIAFSGEATMPGQNAQRLKVNAAFRSDRVDFDDLMAQLNPATESAAQKAANAKKSASTTSFEGFTLPFDGRVQGRVDQLNYGGKQYSNIAFDVTGQGNGLTISALSLSAIADTSLVLKGTISNTLALKGLNLSVAMRTGNFDGLAKAYSIPVNFSQPLGAASVDARLTGDIEQLNFDARVNALGFIASGKGTARGLPSNPVIDALALQVQHPSLQSAVRNFNPAFSAPGNFSGPLDLSANIALNGKKYDLTGIKGRLGGVSVAGAVAADLNATKPSIVGDLALGNIVFSPSMPTGGQGSANAGRGGSSANDEGARWSREAIDTGWMQLFNADLKIRASSITQDLWRLSDAVLAFRLNDGALKISNLEAGIFGGKVGISGNMKASDAKAPLSMDWQASARQIDVRQLLNAVQNKQTDTLSGNLNAFNLTVSSQGNSPAALIYALNGRGDASGKNILIKDIDAAKLADAAKGSYKPLERAGNLFSSFQDGQTAFSDFTSVFRIDSGVINFTELKFDGAQALLNSTGNVNLPRWTIDLKNTMTIKNSDIPPFDFAISGSLDRPLQTGGSIIENYLRQKAQAKIEKVIGKELEKRLGISPDILKGVTGSGNTVPVPDTAPANTFPSANETPQKSQSDRQTEQIEQGVKALQNIFGR